MLSKLAAIIEEETGKTGISLSTRLDSLVEDSLEFLSLVCAVENEFHFKVPDKKYQEVQTVADLCSFMPDHVSN